MVPAAQALPAEPAATPYKTASAVGLGPVTTLQAVPFQRRMSGFSAGLAGTGTGSWPPTAQPFPADVMTTALRKLKVVVLPTLGLTDRCQDFPFQRRMSVWTACALPFANAPTAHTLDGDAALTP